MSTPYYDDEHVTLYHGDAAAVLAELEPGSVDCIVTSPPYFGLRDYGVDGQLGAEVGTLLDRIDRTRRVVAAMREFDLVGPYWEARLLTALYGDGWRDNPRVSAFYPDPIPKGFTGGN